MVRFGGRRMFSGRRPRGLLLRARKQTKCQLGTVWVHRMRIRTHSSARSRMSAPLPSFPTNSCSYVRCRPTGQKDGWRLVGVQNLASWEKIAACVTQSCRAGRVSLDADGAGADQVAVTCRVSRQSTVQRGVLASSW